MALKRWLSLFGIAFFIVPSIAAAEEKIYQTGETSPMEFAKKFEKQEFLFGGGGNVVLSTNDVVDTIAGGVVKARYTFLDFLSIETAVEFNRLPVQQIDPSGLKGMGFRSEADDDLFVIPIVPTLLVHLPPWDNFRVHFLGGVGYQFNDADDIEVDVTSPGSVPVGELDVEIDDGVIFVVGSGFDVLLSRHLVLNFDVRYQFAEFDIESKGVVAGIPVSFTEKDEHFDSVVLRGALLYRF